MQPTTPNPNQEPAQPAPPVQDAQPIQVTQPPTNDSAVPKTWPGAFGLLKYSKSAIGHNLGTIIILLLIGIFASVIINVAFGEARVGVTASPTSTTANYSTTASTAPTPEMSMTSLYAQLLLLVVNTVISIATLSTIFAGIDQQKMSIGEALKTVKPRLALRFLGLSIATAAIMFLTLLALIVPFFFVVPRIILAPYYLIASKMNISDALKASWHDTKGNMGKIYGIIGVNLLFALMCITVIGIPVAIYFIVAYSAATPILYQFLERKKVQGSPATLVVG